MKLAIASTTLLLLLGTTAGNTAEKERVHVGEIRAVSRDSIELSRRGSIISIGFYGEADVLEGLADLRVGDEVRAVFGAGTPPGETRSINKLVHIRRCVGNDKECAADRRAEEAQDVIYAEALAASQQRYAQCRRAMDETLLEDPRYVPSTDSSRAEADTILRQVNSFTGERRACADAIMTGQRSAVFDACEIHHCGDNTAGGCDHIAGYALSTDVIRRAALECKTR